jgi:hypothetical protein
MSVLYYVNLEQLYLKDMLAFYFQYLRVSGRLIGTDVKSDSYF